MKIVVLDGYTANPGDLSWEGLELLGEVTVYDRTKPNETVARAAEAEIVITNKVVIGREEMAQLPHLIYIGVLATGYNVVDIAAARDRGIIVTNVPAYSTESVAQMVFAHLLTVTNHTERYAIENRQGRWSSNPDFCYYANSITELADKTFGIVGLGNIGQRVAQIAQAFGMKVKAFTSKPAEALPEDIQKADLKELFQTSDIISLHCPLTPDTHHLTVAVNLDTLGSLVDTHTTHGLLHFLNSAVGIEVKLVDLHAATLIVAGREGILVIEQIPLTFVVNDAVMVSPTAISILCTRRDPLDSYSLRNREPQYSL